MRIIFVNLHCNEFLVKTSSKFLFKQSAALKHRYILDYLLSRPEFEICTYINEYGFSLAKSLPGVLMELLKRTRFFEHWIIMRKNHIPRKSITIIKDPSEIKENDIVISYIHTPSSLKGIASVKALKAISCIHILGLKSESKLVKEAKPDVLYNESNLFKTSSIFKNYYSWYNKDVLVHPFVAASRFQRIKPFSCRENKVFSTGTITYRYYDEFIETYKDPCNQPIREIILKNKDELSSTIDCYNYRYLEDDKTKEYCKTDNKIMHFYKVLYNMFHIGRQKKYFSFDMVEKFNEYKMCLIGEEIMGVPGIGFVEGMSCGCAYIGQESGFYEVFGMIAGKHYIGYDGSLADLKKKIKYYRQPEHQSELENIANNGYEFAKANFNANHVAQTLIKNLISLKKNN